MAHLPSPRTFIPSALLEGKREGWCLAGAHQPRLLPSQTTPQLADSSLDCPETFDLHTLQVPGPIPQSPLWLACRLVQSLSCTSDSTPHLCTLQGRSPHPTQTSTWGHPMSFPSLFSLTPFGEETQRHMQYSPCGTLLWGNCSKIKGFLGNFQEGSWIGQYLDYANFRSI